MFKKMYSGDQNKEKYPALQQFYRELLHQFGPQSAQALAYHSRTTQIARFSALCKMLPKDTPATLLDVGCGLGDLWIYLQTHGFTKLKYTGIDIIPEMIETAREKYSGQTFIVQDVDTLQTKHDYIIASGALTIVYESPETQLEYVQKYIRKMFEQTNIALGFNCLLPLTDEESEPDPRYFDSNPQKLLTYCRLLTNNLELITGYLPDDFTIVLRKS
jgi:cyclopropane fatty-acyl-phospholipid synthase-like methyltransferase